MELIYTSDTMPGYQRIRRGKGFSFLLPDGGFLSDPIEKRRIRSLAIPPAYERVWICIQENGHLQATGIDARRRKQYRYHPAWHAAAADRKFDHLTHFALTLPKIRLAIRRSLAKHELSRDRVIAGIIALLDQTGYRIGNLRYAKENRTYGLSTLLISHLKQDQGRYRLKFRGKAGHEHRMEINDARISRLISDLQELPGQHLFCYEDTSGHAHEIDTTDVNDWIKNVSGGDYSAKQFRTWRATVLCATELAATAPPEAKTAQERMIRDAIKATAAELNHTPTTCRKFYIHPKLLDTYRDGSLFRIMNAAPPRLRKSDGSSALRMNERRVYKILHI